MPTIQIPVDLRNPRITSLGGNSFWSVVALTAWDAGHWEFVKDVEGKVYGLVRIPKSMATTPNAKIILVIAANATTGVTTLQVSTKAVESLTTPENFNFASFNAITAQDITVPATAYLAKEVSFTVGETLAAEDELILELFHDGDAVNDTLAVNTLLLDCFLEIDVT